VKLIDKLAKVDNSFTVTLFDNGYTIEIGGRDAEDNWKTARIVCNSSSELHAIISEAVNLPRND
jgi:hypothetical protein